ncbi:MAG: alpha/beta hydrolase [Actinobacteria bacterium]|nr:alpha/beta hydrolase [Actinomycetota bacterium]
MEINATTIETSELTYGCLTAGESGPLALCLHGFPDTAHGWRYLLPALADAGFRAVAPFMRGYAPTSIPADGQYHVATLARDATALHEALGGDSDAVIIGHDWGALATYGAAAYAPERWRRVVTAAVPPAASMATAMTNYDQLKRSWYMFFFQVGLSDYVVSANDLEFIDRLWADWSPGHDATVDMDHIRTSIGSRENLAAALGYYRATWGTEPVSAAYQDIQDVLGSPPPQPTLYIHGRNDGCVGVEFAETAAAGLSPGSSATIIEGAGHFTQVEKPEEFNRLVLDFIQS